MNRLPGYALCCLLGLPALACAQQVATNPSANSKDAGNEAEHVHYAWANVTRVDPVYRVVQVANPPLDCAPTGGRDGKPATDKAKPGKARTVAVVKPADACVQGPKSHEERRIVGYNVEYRYRGNVYLSRMSYDPGERLRVKISVTPAD